MSLVFYAGENKILIFSESQCCAMDLLLVSDIRTSSLAVKIGDYIVRPGETVHHHIESNPSK